MFVFPGQGGQWLGMGRELLDSSTVFTQAMSRCAEVFESLVPWSLLDVIRGSVGAPSLERVDVVQPVTFAVMVSLAELWQSVGVVPQVVLGHSQGEVAAAYVAGALSLEDAARVVITRSRLVQQELVGRGGMVSVSLSADAVGERLTAWPDRLGIAAINGPGSVVVSGEIEALEQFLAACEHDEVRARRIQVDYASHSPQVEVLREQLVGLLADVRARSSEIAFCSTVTGALLDTALLDADYWFDNLRQTVRFEQATRTLLDSGHTAFVETGPHPLLTPAIEQTCETVDTTGQPVVVVGSLRRDEGGLDRFLQSVAQLDVVAGVVDWSGVFADSRARRVVLPTYAFQRQRYWR
ncbi:acyltransferase domain-containing protein, partial [Nocardia asteroides]|uniref:acyltransferase domain-containing protein n=1 Tax=Nocardia asteroides TaxID=1824 RepID=UPI00343ED9D6